MSEQCSSPGWGRIPSTAPDFVLSPVHSYTVERFQHFLSGVGLWEGVGDGNAGTRTGRIETGPDSCRRRSDESSERDLDDANEDSANESPANDSSDTAD